jgi:hypothetical protein
MFLAKNTDYNLDALYLAGDAAECSLKSLILERTPKSKRAAVCEEISSGAKAHNLGYPERHLESKTVLDPRRGSREPGSRQARMDDKSALYRGSHPLRRSRELYQTRRIYLSMG